MAVLTPVFALVLRGHERPFFSLRELTAVSARGLRGGGDAGSLTDTATWACQKSIKHMRSLHSTDNSDVVRGLDRGELHCTSDKQPSADEWKNIFPALTKNENYYPPRKTTCKATSVSGNISCSKDVQLESFQSIHFACVITCSTDLSICTSSTGFISAPLTCATSLHLNIFTSSRQSSTFSCFLHKNVIF